MISFIVIGRNVEQTIRLCLDSIANFIEKNSIAKWEIIYVDSSSRDRSVDIASISATKILQISGAVNAAIGRNVGAKHAEGDILFFVDGDMEILEEVYDHIFSESLTLKYPFIRGAHHHFHYDGNFNYLFTVDEPLLPTPILSPVTGGLMIIKKYWWETNGGMDERLIRNQDIDFGLRMSKTGIPALLVNQYFVNHHIVSYSEPKRFVYFLTSQALFAPGILMRKHIFNREYLKRHFREVIYAFYLAISLLLMLFSPITTATLLTLYAIFTIARVVKSRNRESYLLQSFLFKFLYNFYVLFGFLIYYPSSSKYTVNTINKV